MHKVVLVCASGMSTSLLMNKIKAAAKAKGLEIDVTARSESEIVSHYEGADVILLAPQARYLYQEISSLAGPHQIAVGVIDPVMYGRMDGEAVLNCVLELIRSKTA